jgi:hypothetical protein
MEESVAQNYFGRSVSFANSGHQVSSEENALNNGTANDGRNLRYTVTNGVEENRR